MLRGALHTYQGTYVSRKLYGLNCVPKEDVRVLTPYTNPAALFSGNLPPTIPKVTM